MAQPPSASGFTPEDYQGEEGLAQFIEEFNPAYRQLVSAIDGELTRGANLAGFIYSGRQALVIETGASLAPDASPFPLFVKFQQSAPPKLLGVGRVEVLSGAIPTAAVQLYWEPNSDGNRLKIRFATGLAVSSRYRLTLWSE